MSFLNDLMNLGKLGFNTVRYASLNKAVIGSFANAAKPRPRRWSMKHNYTSWRGLYDRRYTGRHLDEEPAGSTRQQPDKAELIKLFLRPEGEMIEDKRTSVLFLFFAQWFTDSFLRTDLWDHKLTDSNHEIDLCALYGLTEEKTDMLRDPVERHLLAHEDGVDGEFPPKLYARSGDDLIPKIIESPDEHYHYNPQFMGETVVDGWQKMTTYLHDPRRMVKVTQNAPVERLKDYYAMGLEHGNGTLGYVVMNILFLRAHNKIARYLREIYCPEGGDPQPGWDLDRVFQTTRNIMIVVLLKIVVEDYISHIAGRPFTVPIGFADNKRWGKTNRIAIEFNLLYRWHSLVPDRIEAGGQELGAEDFLHNSRMVEERGLADLLSDFSKQKAGRMSLLNHPSFFAEPAGTSTLDRTLDIVSRSKLRSMNEYRQHFGLEEYDRIEDLVGDEQPNKDILIAKLREHYGTIDNVDWFVGLFAEKHRGKTIMGELMLTMVGNDAFTQALTNPLLSAEIFSPQGAPNATFTKQGKDIIERISSLQDLADYVLGAGVARCSFGKRD